jgi:hypothetical protein
MEEQSDGQVALKGYSESSKVLKPDAHSGYSKLQLHEYINMI